MNPEIDFRVGDEVRHTLHPDVAGRVIDASPKSITVFWTPPDGSEGSIKYPRLGTELFVRRVLPDMNQIYGEVRSIERGLRKEPSDLA